MMSKVGPILISIILFSGAMLGMASFYQDISTAYAVENSTAAETLQPFNETMNRLNVTMSRMEERVTRFDESSDQQSDWFDSVLLFIDALIVMGQMPDIVMGTITHAFRVVPIALPPFIPLIIFTIVIVIFVLRMVSIATKTDEI